MELFPFSPSAPAASGPGRPLVSDMESSVLALAELTREEADSGVPALIRLRNLFFSSG